MITKFILKLAGICADCLKSGNLNLLERSEPVRACNGIALPFQPFIDQCYFQVTYNFNMFSGLILTLFLHKPKLLKTYNILLRYKLGFPINYPVFSRGFVLVTCWWSGPGSSVGIATGFGLDDPGIESRWWRDLPHLSRPTLGFTQPGTVSSPGVESGRGDEADPSPPSSAVVWNKVALYLFSP
jgi:hypothetical protein